jgi:hypothetical protein
VQRLPGDGLRSHASIGSLPKLKFKHSGRRTIREFNFVFIEHLAKGIKLDPDHDSRVAWIQKVKSREHNDSIANLELLHHGRADVLWASASTGARPPSIFDESFAGA